jgi:hypothetical protein
MVCKTPSTSLSVMNISQLCVAELVVDSLPAPNLRTATRDDIMAYFLNSFDLNSSLFAVLANDAVFYMKPDPLRRPLM